MSALSVRPTVTARIRGQEVPILEESVNISSDSPVDFHLPPQVGGITGASADLDVAPTETVAARQPGPWSPLLQARPDDPVEIRFDDKKVFTGKVSPFSMSLRSGGGLPVSCDDHFSEVEKTFSAPATLKRLAPLPGSTQERPVGCSGLFYVDRALAALGVNSTTRLAGRSVLHVPMAGSAHPVVGTVQAATQRATGGGAVSPWVEPLFRPMSGGRIGVLDPYLEYTTDASRSEATVGSWHLTVEIDPTSTGWGFTRTRGMSDEAGFGFILDPDGGTSGGQLVLTVNTWDAAGAYYPATYQDQGQTLTEVPVESWVERVLVVYNVTAQTLQARLQRADGSTGWWWDFTPATGTAPPYTTTTRQLRARQTGYGAWGAISLMSRAGWIGVADNDFINEPRGVSYDLSTARLVRWSRMGYRPVQNENAIDWLMKTVVEMRSFIYVDDDGVAHLADPADWRDLPVSHRIADATVVGGDVTLDDVQVSLAKRRPYSRVRVRGQRIEGDVAWGPGMKPNRLYAAANEEIVVRAGDPPREIWLECPDDRFWVGQADLAVRYAGEEATEPWHLPDDFARGRGSWVGGHIRDIMMGNMIRWATPAEVLFEVEQVGADRIKVTITPGPGLGPDEEFINLPNPESTSLSESNPRRFSEPLPRMRGPGLGRLGVEIEGVSDDITVDHDGWADLEEYVHEAGLSVQSESQAEELAQILADSHMNDFGLLTVECALDPDVKIGQRVHIEPKSRADVTGDGVVVGIPERNPGSVPRMVLKVWSLGVTVNSITYGERAALVADQDADDLSGSTYGDDKARHTGLTYAQERDLSEMTRGDNLAPPVTSATPWSATLGNDTVAAVTHDGWPALRVTEDSAGTSLYLHPVEHTPVAAGDTLYLSAEVMVSQDADMRWWVVGQDGATVVGGNDPFPPTQTPADGWVRITHFVTITTPGTVRTNMQARSGMFDLNRGFYVRDYQVRNYR